ncbi:hypothetical protein [Bradyrhizobium sp. USDA 10063]
MDNFDPSNVPAWSQVQHAVSEEQQSGQAGQEAFEQQLAEARGADATPVVGEAVPHDPDYPHLPESARSLIDGAVQAEAARRKLSQRTAQNYAGALRRLEKDLGSRGETIAALDHNSLVARAEKFLSRDSAMAPALTALQKYREPNAPDGARRRYVVPSAKDGSPIDEAVPPVDNYPHLSGRDRDLINEAMQDLAFQSLQRSTGSNYAWALRTLGNDLGSRGKTIDALDHGSLVSHARVFFPRDGHMLSALTALHKYREPGASADGGRRYVSSEEDANLIEGAVQAAAARRGWIPRTTEKYYKNLRKLAKSLESKGQTIAALDHNSLAAHAKASYGVDKEMNAALEVLLEHREPGILAARTRGDHVSSVEDKSLIEAAARTSGRPDKAVETYVKSLLRFAGALNADGQSIDNLDYIELVKLAKKLFPGNKSLISGLGMIRDFRKAEHASGAGGFLHAEDDLAVPSPMLSVDPEELRRLLNDQPVHSQPVYNSAELPDAGDQAGQLPTESWDTAKLLEMLASPARSPADTVNQPSPPVPSPVQVVDPEQIWLGADQPGQLPAESLDTAKLLEMFASPRHSPADSVNQPNPSPLWDLGGSSSGAAYHAEQSQPVMPKLELYLPQGWQHGDQWAPEDLKEGMRLHDVLPSASQPETNLTIRGLNYTATIGPPGLEHEIFLRRT